MADWILNQQNLVTFVLVDAAGAEVAGLGNAFTLEISKAGGAFSASAGVKSEISDGWYAYLATAGEADTVGPVSLRITHASIIQQNLEYDVVQKTVGAIAFTYTVTNSATLLPIEGVAVWVTTDVGGSNVVWRGNTDAFGVARDNDNGLPYLDAGTYQFFCQRAAFTFANPDAEVVSGSDTTGETTGTPVSAAGGGALGDVEPLPWTILSLEQYRDIMGISPPHFWSAAGSTYFPVLDSCDNIWWKHHWQRQDTASRLELAQALLQAEQEMADYFGWYPAPIWIREEPHQYTQHFRRDLVGLGRSVGGGLKSVKAGYGYFIGGGVRATTLIDDAVAVVYSDEDGDGFNETASITVTSDVAVKEVKVYFAGTEAEQEWEVRTPRKVTTSGGNIVIKFWAWQLLSPLLQEAYPTVAAVAALDIEDNNSYVATVDVYREYNDSTTRAVEFTWGRMACSGCGGAGCAACDPTTQTGCIHSINDFTGQVMPQPATYGTSWQSQGWTDCTEPKTAKLWYYAGNVSERYKRNGTVNPLDRKLATALAYLATSRLPKSPCSCGNSLLAVLQNDLAVVESTTTSFRFSVKEVEENPFGTTVGDLLAWKMISKMRNLNFDVALV